MKSMKKVVLLLSLIMVLFIGCGGKSHIMTVKYNGQKYIVHKGTFKLMKEMVQMQADVFNERRCLTEEECDAYYYFMGEMENMSDREFRYFDDHLDAAESFMTFLDIEGYFSSEMTAFIDRFDYYDRDILSYKKDYNLQSKDELVDLFMEGDLLIVELTLPEVIDFYEEVYGVKFKL